MRMLSIHPDNRSVIEDHLREAAGKAKSQTITTFDAMIRALDLVRRDLARRFPVPEALDFSVRYVHSRGLGYCLTTELIFRRSGGVWCLDGVRKRSPLRCPHPWITYLLEPWSFAVFGLYARDGRSMRSVEQTDGELTAHQTLALNEIAASLPPRRRTRACTT